MKRQYGRLCTIIYDLSDEMLDACRKKCRIKNLDPDIFRADIRESISEKKYDYIFIPIGSVSILTDEEDLVKSFSNLNQSLNKNGMFIFSFLNLKSSPSDIVNWSEKMRYSLEENKNTEIICLQKLKFIKVKGIIDIKLKYELRENSRTIETEYQDFPLILYDPVKMRILLDKAGFKYTEDITPDIERSVFSVFKCIAR